MDQGEVVHWMSALNPELVQYGKDLVNRGYSTLDSVALLVEEDIDNEIRPQLRVSRVLLLVPFTCTHVRQ